MATEAYDVRDAPSLPGTPFEHRVRWTLLVCWVLLLGWCAGFAERPGSLDQLEGQVGAGHVHHVQVGPPALPGDAVGSGSQEVHWRQGLVLRRGEVTMRTGTDQGDDAADSAVRRGRDIAPQLQRLDPDLTVTRTSRVTSEAQVYGWYVPSWLGLAAFVLILVTLGVLISGPRPWRATRWAWFWLMATPVGVLAFLALSGRTPGLPVPRPGRRPLGGFVALLLAALMASFLPSWWHSG